MSKTALYTYLGLFILLAIIGVTVKGSLGFVFFVGAIGALVGAVVAYAGNALIAGTAKKPSTAAAAADAKQMIRSSVEPRRVVSSGVRAPRPLADPTASLLANSLPAVDPAARFTSANRNDRPGTPHHDDHVLCYEHHLRAALLRAADATEIEALRKAQGILPVEARLSTWAVSLAVATVSLPVAAPVMIYNLARGEDMRVASLAMGLAGLFLALDSSGAMAAVTGF
jgi:hypothetical protein